MDLIAAAGRIFETNLEVTNTINLLQCTKFVNAENLSNSWVLHPLPFTSRPPGAETDRQHIRAEQIFDKVLRTLADA